ncbi:type II toxin-antitoxin system PemK/MazF family toxin [Candidatus Pacearchaeota archaeon]|nr:type II toxin-antitoxin system PemK/MazF family toxin [Candidatus Pacearchaeota archaeon]
MRYGIIYNRGDIVLVPFIYSDLSNFKLRPALIISNNLVKFSENKICCLITSKPWPGDISIEKSDLLRGNLPVKSFVRPEVMLTVNSRMIRRKLGEVNPSLIKKVVLRINEYIN